MGTAEEQLLDEIRRLKVERATLLAVLRQLAEVVEKLNTLKVDGENWREVIRICL